MRNQHHYFHLLVFLITLSFIIINTSANATNISGHITQDDTLTLAESPYVVTADVTVDSAVTLVIEAGVEINLAYRDRDFVIAGNLIAEGTEQDTIRFYSTHSQGGGSLAFLEGSTGSLLYTRFNKLGTTYYYNTYDCALYIYKADVSVDHCSFANNVNDVRASAASVGDFGPSNSLNVIYLFNNSLDTSCVWPIADSTGFRYHFFGDLTVSEGDTLTIAAGVQVEFPYRDRDLHIYGHLISEGTAQDNIRFYSNHSQGGGSIAFLEGSSGSLLYSEFDKLGVTYYYNTYDCALYIYKAEVSVDHCSFANNVNDVRSGATSVGDFGPSNSLNAIYLFDNSLDTTCVWPVADSSGFRYHFFGDLTVAEGDTLTIDPGVWVEFPDRDRDLHIYGHLISAGTTQDNIRFYSNSTRGGGSVAFREGSTGNLRYTEFDKLGIQYYYNTYDCALYLYKADEVSVDHCSFVNNVNDVRSDATSVGDFGPNNSLNAIYFFENSLDTSSVWPIADAGGFRYYLFGDMTVEEDDTLTIDPGVWVEFPDRSKDFHIYGHLISEGTAQDTIRFYSNKSEGGGSLAFLEGSSGSLLYTEFNKLGIQYIYNTYDCALYVYKAEVSLDHCSFANNVNDLRSDAVSVSTFGSNNDLNAIYLFANSLDESSVWPNVDPNGFQYYFFGDMTLPAGKTLAIDPGVQVNFPDRDKDFHIYGDLISEGTEQEPIQFFSSNTSRGGGSLAFLEGSTGNLLYTEFDRLGVDTYYNTYDCGLYINKADVSVNHCSFSNTIFDVRATATSVGGFGSTNDLNGIYLFTNSLDTTSVWPNADVNGFKYHLFGDLTLPMDDTLTIAPGVWVDLGDRDRDMHIYGTVIAEGTEQDSIKFYSTSSRGGGSLAFLAGSTDSRLKYNIVERLAVDNYYNTYDCAIRLEAPCEITNSTIRNNARGIWINADVSPLISENWIHSNTTGIQISQSGDPTITYNSIENNTSWGLYNTGDEVNACNNYWGDSTGPYNATNNPAGLGNKISDNVLAADCLLTEPTYVAINPTITETSCIGDSDGSISLEVTGGTPPYLYEWGTGSTDTIISGLIAGDYSVTVTDADSLTAMNTYTVSDPPQVTITVDKDTICFGDSIILTANFANTTNWSTGETSAQITVSPTVATTYYLSGEYAANCPYNDSIIIEVTPYNPPGEVTDMLPANNAMNLLPPLNLSWIPTNNTTHYDLYIWQVGTDRPLTPTVADIAAINYEYTGTLEYATPYNWQLIAKNECFGTEGIVQQFSLRELPDIVVSNISTPIDPVFSGQTLSISWIVENTGLGQTLDQQWIDAVYISTDATFEPGTDIYLGGISNFEALNPTENYLQTADLTLPNGIEGNYYVFVSADHYGALLETNNDNNVTSSPGPILIELTDWPDLVVSDISILGNTTVFAGGTADIQYEVTNNVSYDDAFSGGTIIHSWKDRIHLSQDSILSGNDYLLKTITHTQADGEQMMAGESYTETHTVNIPNIYEENSTYFILVSTDIQNKVYEYLFDYNNTSASGDSLTLIYLPPNIRPQSITGPASANNKDMISINWEIINDGVGTATNNWRDRVFLSPNSDNSIGADDVEISSQYQTADLALGATYNRQKTIIVPPNIGGTYYLKIFADANNNINELDREDDNILVSAPIDIQTADLLPVAFDTPNSTLAGQYVEIDWTLSNIGLGKINSSNWEDNFYLSPTSTFDANTAIQIETYNQIAVLESGDSLSRTLNVLLPEDLAESNYYWTIKTNANNGIFENGDTLNNIYTNPNPIFVEAFPPADLEVTQFNAPDTTLAGTDISVDFTILNNGPGATSPVWIDRIYLSAAPFWMHPDSAILLKQFAVNESIAADSTYEQQTTLSLPMLPGGLATNTCYLYAFANSNGNLYEGGNAANNILRSNPIHVIAPNTDLNVFCFMPPNDTLYSGSTIDIRWTVENLGDSTGLNNYWYWYDGVYLSEDTLFDASDEFIFDYAIYNTDVENNRYSKVNQPLEIPNGISGDHYLFMVADHTDLNYDTDSTNNASLRTLVDGVILRGDDGLPKPIHFIVPPSADLSIQDFDAPMEGVSGQPITVDWTIKNNGLAATTNDWNDKIYLSTDLTLDEDDILLATHPHEGILAIGDTYSVNAQDVFLPIDADGIYVLIFATDADDTEYEYQAESNNILTTYITIEQPMPSDLIITQITNPSAGTVGQNFAVNWTVQNMGTNPATGFMREAVYLSTDTIMDTDDVLVGILDNNINLAPLATATHTLNTLLPGIELGEYYILMETDLLNNILETDETNNGLVSDNLVDVDIPELPLNVLTPNVLQNDIPLYYRIEIADSLYNETLQIELEGDSINGSNELYVSFAATPSRVDYEHAELTPFLGNQELIVPNLSSGTHYLMVHGLTTAAAQQDISLLATILEFGIRSVDANEGGNNGRVSVRIKGARFEEDMAVILNNGSAGIYIASEVHYIDPTTIYATFDLTGANVGLYDVEVRRDDGTTAVLEDGFEIIEGSPPSLVISIDHPPNTRLNRIVPMTLHVVNDGLTDVPVREIYAISTQGAPLGRTVTELEEGRNDIPIDLHIPGEPLNVIRPGGTVSVTFYTLSDSPMRFQLVDIN